VGVSARLGDSSCAGKKNQETTCNVFGKVGRDISDQADYIAGKPHKSGGPSLGGFGTSG